MTPLFLRRGLVALAAAGALAAVAGPSSASAATLSDSLYYGGQTPIRTLIYTAAPGENNNVRLTNLPDGRIKIEDDVDIAFDVFARDECEFELLVQKEFTCSTAFDRIDLRLKDGNNELRSDSYTPMTANGIGGKNWLYGGPGPDSLHASDLGDTLDGGGGHDGLHGGGGADRLAAGWGDDVLLGYGGDDQLDPGIGSDLISGGEDADRVSYADRDDDVSVTIDNVADDGEAGEEDFVEPDVETVIGGSGNDSLTSKAALPRRLFGNAGNDTLKGGRGADELVGGSGDDDLEGGYGGDLMSGGADMDELANGPGADTFDGGDGFDMLSYSSSAAPVHVDLDGAADDGAQDELDNAKPGIEQVNGSPHPDTLTGSAAGELLLGGGGNDTLRGLGGSDQLYGDAGFDTLYADDGVFDKLYCGTETDFFKADAADQKTACETALP